MRYILSLLFLLIGFWLVNSGYYTGLLLALGLGSITLVLLICHRMNIIDHESWPLQLLPNIFPFYGWLIKEIVLGCIEVLKLIVQGPKLISPEVFSLKLDFNDEISKGIFANSITLVPGTLTLEIKNDTIVVHALTRKLADDLRSGELASRVKRLEKSC